MADSFGSGLNEENSLSTKASISSHARRRLRRISRRNVFAHLLPDSAALGLILSITYFFRGEEFVLAKGLLENRTHTLLVSGFMEPPRKMGQGHPRLKLGILSFLGKAL